MILVLLEHLQLPLLIGNLTIQQYCLANRIPQSLHSTLLGMYFRHTPEKNFSEVSYLPWILRYLKNSHTFYLEEKYREALGFIHQMYEANSNKEILLVEKFFEDYMAEVKEHLDYEENIAFPYFTALSEGKEQTAVKFSSHEYLNHHSDINTKLSDLKQLLNTHLPVGKDYTARRKAIKSLIELEFDLEIHTWVEEYMLVPLVQQIERSHAERG